ncbi:MAG: DAK2 domain-containing protein [Dehalococcoidia bacterium]|nr:DAK2 domain-containing protein [Dehalococcoidia bacterium]
MTRSESERDNNELIDGMVLCALVAAGSRAVETNRDQINALNVFPVPDGDTGTNMSLTLRAIVEESAVQPTIHAGDAAQRMARSALLAARGNSGLISAQLFRGIAEVSVGRERISPEEFASGMRAGAVAAYDSVPNPREGTMLTVMRVTADTATESAAKGMGIDGVLEAAVQTSIDAVALTPTQLDVLMDAGVVDSGGYGLSVFLSGALEMAQGRGDGSTLFPSPDPIGVESDARSDTGVRIDFVEAVQEEIFGYCTVFLIEGEGLDVAEIREKATTFGESAVVAGDSTAVKIHLHPLDPGPVMSYGAALGTLAGITILNMDEQTSEWAADRQSGDTGSPAPAIPAPDAPRLETAIVAVCDGDGLRAVFAQAGMGACSPVTGGDTMNPSVQDLLSAVEAAPSDQVLLLPNNGNIVAAALQVPDLTDKTVQVVQTRSVQAGIAAVFAFSATADLDANAAAMTDAAADVKAGSVTRAVRDAVMSGQEITNGDAMALVDGDLVAMAPDPLSALVEMIRLSTGDAELITIYSGADFNETEADGALDAAREAAGDDAEVELVGGGQPHYDFLVAFE